MNEEQENRNRLLNTEEAAAKLKVSKKTLLKWARERKIGSVRFSPRIVCFSEEQLAEFIRRMSQEIKPEKRIRPPALSTTRPTQPPFKKSGKQEAEMTLQQLREEMRSWGRDDK